MKFYVKNQCTKNLYYKKLSWITSATCTNQIVKKFVFANKILSKIIEFIYYVQKNNKKKKSHNCMVLFF